jgi:2-methylcitrate dehydratase
MQTGDRIQSQLSSYAAALAYEQCDDDTVHAAKVRVIDTFGALVGGFAGDPCRIARDIAAQMPNPNGATIIGTDIRTAPDLAAFANGTTARYVEMNDVYHWPGSSGGHPSDVLMPIFAAAERAHTSGRDFITAVILGYEVYLRLSDAVKPPGFDCANFCCIGAALGAGKLFGLDLDGLAECLSMAVVPNNALNQARTGHLSMWKAVAAGQSGRAGVFAALLAQAGMRGPHMPFEGKNGWSDHVARHPVSLDTFGGPGVPFKIHDTLIKPRASCATTISSILAAEKAAVGVPAVEAIEKVTVEVYERAKTGMGTGEHHWNPDSRETADHSIPYVVAASLIDKQLTPKSFANERLWSAELRALLPRIEVVADPEFTEAYERVPVEHRTRVTVVLKSGEQLIGYAGGEAGDLSQRRSDAEIEDKFRALTCDALTPKGSEAALRLLWRLDAVPDVAEIPAFFRFT